MSTSTIQVGMLLDLLDREWEKVLRPVLVKRLGLYLGEIQNLQKSTAADATQPAVQHHEWAIPDPIDEDPMLDDGGRVSDEGMGYAKGWNACRKAMLATAPRPAAQAQNALDADVAAELDRATAKFPTWPTDPLHAVAVLGEEYGELVQATLQHVYEPHKSTLANVRDEAIQTAAMARRFVRSIHRYEFKECAQHSQNTAMARESE